MMRKIISIMLAVTLVLGMFASTAVASELPSSVQPLLAKLEAVLAKLEQKEREAIDAARDTLENLSATERKQITEPAWLKIKGKLSVGIDEESVSDLFVAILSIQYGNAESELLRVYRDHLGTIGAIVEAGGTTLDDVSFDDLAELVTILENAMQSELRKMSFADLLIKGLNESFNEIFSKAYAHVIASNNALAAALDNLGINQADMIEMKDRLADKVDKNRRAAYALALGYIRTDAVLSSDSGNSPFKPQLVLLGRTVPGNLIEWSVVSQVSGNPVSVADDGFVVTSGEGTAKVSATLSIFDSEMTLKVFEGNITVTGPTEPSPPTPPTSPSTPVEQPQDPVSIIENVTKELDDLLPVIDPEADPEQVADAAEQAARNIVQLVKEAKVNIERAVREASTVRTGYLATVDGAIAQIETNTILQQIASIQEQVRELQQKFDQLVETANAKLNELGAQTGSSTDPLDELIDTNLDIVLSIDVETGAHDQVEATINQEIIGALKEAGIGRVAVSANGVSVTLSSSELDSDVTIRISRSGTSVAAGDVFIASAQAQTRTAAGQYDVKITSQGQEITQFSEPVTISIPVESVKGFDPELLTVVAVDEDGNYKYYTGKYNDATNTVDALVYSLDGPYTVVETKVAFSDLASVQSWAGREIEVVAAKGIINGKGDNVYDPQGIVTRAEFAKMIVLAFNLHEPDAVENFIDVNDGDWFQSYVASAAKHGLIRGKGEGIFDPLAPITRAEMATIAARALQTVKQLRGVSDADAVLGRFADADEVIESLREGTALAARLGIVIGSDGKFHPKAESTRAAAAVVIYRLIQQ